MGCGASAQPYVPQEEEKDEAPPPAPVEVKVESGGAAVTLVSNAFTNQAGSGKSEKNRGPFLPFVRFDKTAVPKELCGGDEVYVSFVYSGKLLTSENSDGVAMEAEKEPAHALCVEHATGPKGAPLKSGDSVVLRCAASGLYLEAETDSTPLTAAARSAESHAQVFIIHKQGRPNRISHRDIVYLQSWLSNFVQLDKDTRVRARQWKRGEPQTLTILNKKVLETSTTELARKMQFQAFDLDGNGAISRGEMEYMLKQVKGSVTPEELDAVMGACDPAFTGSVPFPAFASWADGGGLTEEQLQHAEVLGNVAQRCNDALQEESALIEVLTTAHPEVCQDVLKKHQEQFASDLSEAIVKKSSEQDGFIFSNYWKTAMASMMENEVDLWTRCLNDAMRGLGTDEDSLTALVCTMPEHLRFKIFKRYHARYGKGLLEHIESETSFSYKKVLIFQAMAPDDCRAKILNNAMAGLGTSEDQLIRVVSLCDFAERRAIQEAYQRMFQRDLVDHVRSETSGDFQKSLLCMLLAEEGEFDLEADCAAMKAAMDGWGTDEEALIKLICSKTSKQMQDVNAKFKELYDKELITRVKNETSGNFQATMLAAIRHPSEQLAHSVRYCMEGWGTDDTGLITLLVHLPDYKKESLRTTYHKLFARDLIKDIKGDTSGDYQNALCALVRPAPEVWADALHGAMKGLGTSDELLINFLAVAKDEMEEVRQAFYKKTQQPLSDWIEGECSGDYKKTLIRLTERNSEDSIDMLPIYWTQRCRDAVTDIDTLKDILVSLPAVAIKRGTDIFQAVYGKSLREEIQKKCSEKSAFFAFSDYWKMTMLSLLDMPVARYVKGLNDAMRGMGTDEFTLTGLVCTMPENLFDDIHGLYKEKYGRTLISHIESECSFNYKKVLVYQAMSWAESRAKALNGAMVGLGTAEDQLIRVVVCATMKERQKVKEAYQALYGKDLIEHIESETSGSFQAILVAVLESTQATMDHDYDADCEALKAAMEGVGTDEDGLIRVLAGKTPEQIVTLQGKFQEKFERSLFDWVDDETWDWGLSVFVGANFRSTILGLLRPPAVQLAYSVRDCIVGFGTDDTGLITNLVHLSERRRRELVKAYAEIPKGGDLYAHIKGDTSGSYKHALLALVRPAPQVWAAALTGAMKGLGTSDELLINWMCIAKDRMDEVRDAFREQNGRELSDWIEGDCSGDYKDTLIRLSRRECYKFAGAEAGLTIAPPPSKEDAVFKFNKCFNELCRRKHKSPSEQLVPPEEAQQEMGSVFLYYSSLSACSPDMDRQGLWDLTNACGFPPADDGDDLTATFNEWDYSGTGTISWNDFVREMATRINDPNHFEAAPLPEGPH